MKKSTILKMTAAIAIMVLGYTNAWSQTKTVPIPGNTLYIQGHNATSTFPGPVDANESPDLVTTGTQVPYLVIPDPLLNPTWVPGADARNITGIVSTWTWTIDPLISASAPTFGHHITIDVNGAAAALGNITVAERSGGACPGTIQTIGLRVVAQPTASALAVADGTAPDISICQSGTNGSLNVPFPVFTATKTTDAAIPGNATIRVKATLVITDFVTGTPTTYFTNAILNVNAAGVISNADITAAAAADATPHVLTDFDNWGSYALTINQISDKISRKDLNGAGGYFAINGVTGYTATYSVLKAPTTGSIYHLPNN